MTVKFGATSPINVDEGDSATITVTISADPEREAPVIPIMATEARTAPPRKAKRAPTTPASRTA